MEVKEIQSRGMLEKDIANGITLINFSAPWYTPCQLQEAIIQQLADQFKGKALIATMNIEEHNDMALKLDIHNIPTLIIFKNGNEIERFIGLQAKETLSEPLTKLLNP